jgi:preprotein translocase subunit YajC
MNPFTLISTAHAQDASGILGNLGQSPLAPLVFIIPIFYFLLIRPQQQKAKELKATLGALKRGDKVVLGGGMIGTVQRVPPTVERDGKSVESSEIEVQIAPNVVVTVLRETITTVIKPVAANDTKPSK